MFLGFSKNSVFYGYLEKVVYAHQAFVKKCHSATGNHKNSINTINRLKVYVIL